MPVHVVGNAGLDTTFRLARLPVPGETLNALGGGQGLGGKGANQAVAASRTGANVAFHGAIGSDAARDVIRASLAAEGLDLRGLLSQDGPSDSSAILVDAAGENAIASLVERARSFDPEASPAFTDGIKAADLLLMQGNLPVGITHACLAFARRRGAATVFNASPLSDADDWRFGDVDWLVVNAGEARSLSGIEDPREAARRLVGQGAAHVILSLGAHGALLAGRDASIRHFPARKVSAIDTSGAGDVLCGVFTGLLAQGHAPERALAIAIAAAGIAVTRPGTLASCPTAAEIQALLSFERNPPA